MYISKLGISDKIIIHRYKHVVEICMDKLGLLDAVANVKLGKEYKTEGAEMPQGYKDVSIEKIGQFYGVAEFDVTVDMLFNYLRDFRHIFQVDDEMIKRVRIEFLKYIATRPVNMIIKDYARTGIATAWFKIALNNYLRKKLGITKGSLPLSIKVAVDDKIDILIEGYRKELDKAGNSMFTNFSPTSQSVVSYLMNAMTKYYIGTHDKDIWDIINMKDNRKFINGQVYDATDDIEVEKPQRFEFRNFQAHASNIQRVSCILFQHNGVVFYNLWALYQYNVAIKRFNKFKETFKKLTANIGVNIMQAVELKDSGMLVDADAQNYRMTKFTCRRQVLQEFDKFMRMGAPRSKYRETLAKLLAVEEPFGSKDDKWIFNHPNKEVRIRSKKYSNEEIFIEMLKGTASVNALARYCAETDIDPLSIPPDIFSNADLVVRATTLSDYLATYQETAKLIEEGNKLQRENKLQIATNDGVVKSLLNQSSQEDYTYESLKRLDFKTTIKSIIFKQMEDKQNIYSLKRAEDIKNSISGNVEELTRYFNSNYIIFKLIVDIIKLYNDSLMQSIKSDKGVVDMQLHKFDTKRQLYTITKWNDMGDQIRIHFNNNFLTLYYNKLTEYIKVIISNKNGTEKYFKNIAMSFNNIKSLNLKNSVNIPLNFYRYYNLVLGLILRIQRMYDEVLYLDKKEGAFNTDLGLISALAKNEAIIDLPKEAVSMSEIAVLMEQPVQFQRYNIITINDRNYKVESLNFVLAKLSTGITGTNALEDMREYIAIYNLVMKELYKFIEPVKEIKDQLWNVLNTEVRATGNVFGRYQNDLVEMSRILDTVTPEELCVSNRLFNDYLKDRMNPKLIGHNFLAINSKPVIVRKNNCTYYVHARGHLYCPSAPSVYQRLDLKENDMLLLEN